jgi:MFS family permease
LSEYYETGVAVRPIFFGWKVVAAAFTTALFAYGAGLYGPSVFLHALQAMHGWAIAVISAAITAQFLFSAAVVAFLADAHRRFGVAAVTRAGTVAFCLGLIGWGFANTPWHLFAAALFTGAGYATMSGAGIIAMVSPWFERQRPAALSHAFNGASLSGVIFVPLWTILIDKLGLAAAATSVSAAMLLVIWSLAGRYLRPTPDSIGLAPDGAPMPGAGMEPPVRPPRRFRALIFEHRFITLSAAFAMAIFAQIGLITHLITRLAPEIGEGLAAFAVTLATACAVAGRLLLAGLMGSSNRRLVAAANFVMQGCGAMLLAFGSGLGALLAGCVLLGLGVGNVVSLPPLIAQVEFERADVPRIISLLTAVNQAVFAFAPAVIGALHDGFGSYAVPFAVAASILFMAGVVIFAGAAPRLPARANG